MKKFAIELKWSIIYNMVFLLWMVMEKSLGLHTDPGLAMQPYVTMLVLIPALAMYILAILDKKSNYYNGIMSYGQSFKTGLWLTAFITLLTPLQQYIISYVITPDYFKNVIEFCIKTGYMTREQALQQFNIQNYLFQSVMSAIVLGVLYSALVSIFTRSKTVQVK